MIDTFGLQLDHATATDDAFSGLQLWHVASLRPFVDSFSVRSTLGKPALFGTDSRKEYGRYSTEIVLRRSVSAFMVKTLVPLFLLMLVVFATLYFPPSLAKERTVIPVTAILTSAVLLSSITNQLPPLGYTVALEYMFYVFFALCLTAMSAGLLSEILRHRQTHSYIARLDVCSRLLYIAGVLVTFGFFWWKYGPGLA